MRTGNTRPVRRRKGRAKAAKARQERRRSYRKDKARTSRNLDEKGPHRARNGHSRRHMAHFGTSRLEDEAKAAFWRVMKWVVPILLSAAVAFYIYSLASLAKPLGRLEAEVEQLRREVERLREDKLESAKESGRPENSRGMQIDIVELGSGR